jgi:hypothetical protein
MGRVVGDGATSGSCGEILIVRHDENLAEGIASVVPNLSTLGQIIYAVSTATISWSPEAFTSMPPWTLFQER